MTQAHEQKESLTVDVNVPEHADRGAATPVFESSRRELMKTGKCRCFICGTDQGLEAHHFPVERCFAEGVDWPAFIESAKSGELGPGPQSFDWTGFDPKNPYTFVDDMRHNGLMLCKLHHTGKDSGIHYLPHAIWIAQKFLPDGYQFSPTEVLQHKHLDN